MTSGLYTLYMYVLYVGEAKVKLSKFKRFKGIGYWSEALNISTARKFNFIYSVSINFRLDLSESS